MSSTTPRIPSPLIGYTDHMLHLRARNYFPNLGTFLSLDPFEGTRSRPLSLNGYSYVEGNVPNWTDPTGKNPYCPGGDCEQSNNYAIINNSQSGWILIDGDGVALDPYARIAQMLFIVPAPLTGTGGANLAASGTSNVALVQSQTTMGPRQFYIGYNDILELTGYVNSFGNSTILAPLANPHWIYQDPYHLGQLTGASFRVASVTNGGVCAVGDSLFDAQWIANELQQLQNQVSTPAPTPTEDPCSQEEMRRRIEGKTVAQVVGIADIFPQQDTVDPSWVTLYASWMCREGSYGSAPAISWVRGVNKNTIYEGHTRFVASRVAQVIPVFEAQPFVDLVSRSRPSDWPMTITWEQVQWGY
jgi:RHS repeat-associated protein